MVPVTEYGCNHAGGEAALYVYDCSQAVEGPVRYCDVPRVATFRLPPLAPGAEYTQNYCCSSEYSGVARSMQHQPFVPDPALRLLAFQIDVTNYDPWPLNEHQAATSTVSTEERAEEVATGTDYDSQLPIDEEEDHSYRNDWDRRDFCRLLLFAHAGSFLRFCNLDAPGADIPWERWAPYARLMPKPADNWLYNSPQAWRICTTENLPDDRDDSVMLYDFAPPCALRRAAACVSAGLDPWEYVLGPSVVVREALFDGEVRSGLPFRRVNTGLIDSISVMPGERHSYRLMDDCILSWVEGAEAQ